MLEATLVILPFFAMILGIIDLSQAFFVRTTLQHSVRVGVRYAVTYQTKPGMCQDASIKEVIRSQAMGFLKPSDITNKVFVRYYKPDTLAATVNNWPGNIVEVSIENYQWSWISPLWRTVTPMTVVARASDRMEGLAGGATVPCR
jgi:Flp pilus assembly protein TadG